MGEGGGEGGGGGRGRGGSSVLAASLGNVDPALGEKEEATKEEVCVSAG